jgi:hypothetical protein
MRLGLIRISLTAIIVASLFSILVNAAGRDTENGARIAAGRKTVPSFDNKQLRLRLMPRSTPQMAAFFEARGFPPVMIERLSNYCFFTVVIKNKMKDDLWLDLAEWRFSLQDSAQQKTIKRVPRSVWPPIWKRLNIPLASQATFRWTLLPETLNFYAHESEGGNIVLEKTKGRFKLHAQFGQGKNKESLLVSVENLQCADALEIKR